MATRRDAALAIVSAVLGVAALSVVTVGAVSGHNQPIAQRPSPGRSVVTWVVPHDQGVAPVVPLSGGAASGLGSFNAISCPSATECVAVGADAKLGGVASTSNDGGSTWVQEKLDANEPQLDAVACFNVANCVAVGAGATVRTSDGGKTWSSSSIPTGNTTLLGVSCPNVTSCVAVGVSPGVDGPYVGQLLVSTDGGTTWSAPKLPVSPGALGSVDCPSSTFCVAVGASIVVSTDGGATWSTRTVNGGFGPLRSVACETKTTCVAVGANPGVVQDPTAAAFGVMTNDGGATWGSVSLPSGSGMLDVISCSSTTCVAVGSALNGAPATFLSSSTGATWTANQTLATSVSAVSALSCTSGTSCVYVGQNGKNPVSVPTLNGVATGTTPVSALVRHQKDVTR